MLIPIGHQRRVRDFPRVTLAILVINIVVFVFTAGSTDVASQMERVDRNLTGAFEYYFAHPYLEFPRELSDKLRPDAQELLVRAAAAGRSPRVLDDPPSEQARLDQLCQTVLGVLEKRWSKQHGFVPARWSVRTALTSLFLHAGLYHLLSNMLLLYLSAPYVEEALGPKLFLALYLAGGIAGVAGHYFYSPGSEVPLVGASGAISAVMGGFLVLFATTKIRFFYFFFVLVGTFSIRAYVVLPVWIALQYLGARAADGGSGVAFWAHIGGFMFGFVVAGAYRLTRPRRRGRRLKTLRSRARV